MHLLLSSRFLTADARPEVLGTGRGGRAALALNAMDGLGTRSRHVEREATTFAGFGFTCEELDLRDHFGRPGELARRLDALDVVWVLGGNAFVLARAMTLAGFGAVVRRQVSRPDFVYGGYSAGACVAGPDLRAIDLIDDPSVLPAGYPPEVEPRCLGLVPFRIVPHWRSDHPESAAAERAAAHLAAAGLHHRRLRDGEFIQVRVAAASGR